MKPAGAAGKFNLLHPVVANVDEASALRSQALKDPDSDQFAICRRPITGVIVARQIVSCFVRRSGKTTGSKLCEMLAQDRLTESTRSAVNAQINRVAADSESRAAFRTRDAFHRLQLRKVISAADRAEGALISGWLNTAGTKELAGIAIPDTVEIAQAIRPHLAFKFRRAKPGSPQSDSAADIVAHQGGI